ncbi:hypothetical protein [Chryseobacterium sp. FH1]|uniref:hypothetical protein n=1 Tax=Chryseobacterium sp. FH1 TaxID=1233951 RepID=UPI0004E2C578|nr:hypothetical protein [Chryseobacterium sp. FH1]KFC19381.1 hypothetical protein IO90_08760 [Chryseobacterium sp. FH1]
MKNKVIKVLKDSESSQVQKYNELLDFISRSTKNTNLVRTFQTGFSPSKYDQLEHQVKKQFEISDLDIYNFQDEENNQVQELTATGADQGNGDQTQSNLEPENKLHIALAGNEPAQEGLKIRDEYEFLNDTNCPEEFHILVGQKITAWKEFAKEHQQLAIILSPEEAETEEGKAILTEFAELSDEEKEEVIYQLAKSTVENFQLNADIKNELDFYKEQGRVLGKHPKLKFLSMKQEIYEMSEADLINHRNNGQKNVSKIKKELEAEPGKESALERLENWEYRVKIVLERLATEFPPKEPSKPVKTITKK